MSFQLSIPDIESADSKMELPSNFRGDVLKGADVEVLISKSTELISQEINFEDFAIRIISGKMLKRLEIKEKTNREGLHVCLMIKNGVEIQIKGFGKIHLQNNFHILSYHGNNERKFILDNEDDFQFLDVITNI